MAGQSWSVLLLFAASILMAALYGLTASGHFPAEHRREALRGTVGGMVLWGTLTVVLVAAMATLVAGLGALPWYASVLAGGGMLLFAPLLLQPLPDTVVDGRSGLVTFSVLAAAFAGALWLMA
jgi:hypothetical protein